MGWPWDRYLHARGVGAGRFATARLLFAQACLGESAPLNSANRCCSHAPLAAAILLCSLLGAGGIARASTENPAGDTASATARQDRRAELRQLVADLGHEEWARRERAQARLLVAPGTDDSAADRNFVLELLATAEESGDPETAHRARLLRERLDPLLGAFDFARIALLPEPEVIEFARGAAAEGRRLRLDNVSLRGFQTDDFRVSWSRRGTDGSVVDVQVGEIMSGVSDPLALSTPVPTAPSISLVKVGEEIRYEQHSVVTARKRLPYVTLLELRCVRQSRYRAQEDDREETPADPAAWLDGLRARLMAQTAPERTVDERKAALLCLGYLHHEPALPLFRAALDSADTVREGALGLGALGHADAIGPLTAIVSGEAILAPPPGGAVVNRPADDPETAAIRVRAAIYLARLDPAAAVPFLLDKLTEGELADAHFVMATLADLVPEIASRPKLRRAFLELALRGDTVSRAPWGYFPHETEFFFRTTLAVLDTANESDRQLASTVLDALEALLTARSEPTRVRLDAVLPLWRDAAHVALAANGDAGERIDETALTRRLLPRVQDTTGLAEVLSWHKKAGTAEPLADETLAAWIECLRRVHDTGDASIRSTVRRRAVELTQSLTIGPGQLDDVVTLLVDLGSASAPSGIARSKPGLVPNDTRLVGELRRLTGSSTGSADPTAVRRTIYDGWRQWLKNSAAIAKRETALRSTDRSAERFALYLFDLEIDVASTAKSKAASARKPPATGEKPEAAKTADKEPTKVLDGRRLVIAVDEPIRYTDRWGQTRASRLTRVGTRPGTTTTYRFEGTTTLTLGTPRLTTAAYQPGGGRWYEVSPLYARARYLSRPTVKRMQRLAYLVAMANDSSDAASEPAVLWKDFVARHLLRLPDAPDARFTATFLRIQRQLSLPEAAPVLEDLLAKQPSVEVAALLAELGRPSGTAFLEAQLANATPSQQLLAAKELSNLGDSRGVRYLLEFARTNPIAFQRQAYTLLNAVDRFLVAGNADAALELELLDFVFGHLKVQSARYSGFKIVARVAGTDFGYRESRIVSSTRSRTNQTKLTPEQKQQAAVAAARAWWAEERPRRARGEGTSTGTGTGAK